MRRARQLGQTRLLQEKPTSVSSPQLSQRTLANPWQRYTGTSNYAAANGSWTFFDPTTPDASRELMRSTYAVISADTANLSFEDRAEGNDGLRDVLTNMAADDDLSMSYADASASATLTVAWSKGTGEGSTTNFESTTCCWGERPDFDDVQCPSGGADPRAGPQARDAGPWARGAPPRRHAGRIGSPIS